MECIGAVLFWDSSLSAGSAGISLETEAFLRPFYENDGCFIIRRI